MKNYLTYIASIACMSVVLLASSCSTTRSLSKDQQRLVSNKIKVDNDKHFDVSELTPYLKQKPGGWNPFIYVYNWENGKGRGWDKFVHKIGSAPVVFDSTLVESSESNLKTHLNYLGYYGSRVSADINHYKPQKVKVNYDVNLGKRYIIDTVTFFCMLEGEFERDFDEYAASCEIKPGQYLSEAALEAETARAADLLRNRGYYDFNKNYFVVEADTVSVPGKARLKMIVMNRTRNESSDTEREMSKYSLGRISVTYPQDLKFRRRVIENLNVLHSGQTYSDRLISTAYSRFSNINAFSSVNLELTPIEGEGIVDCDINLNKGKLKGFKLGLESSINSSGLFGISPELSYYNKNIFHGGEIFNISVSSNHQVKFGNSAVRSNEVGLSASLSLPRFVPLPNRVFRGPNLPRTEIKAAFNYQNRPEFTRWMASASYGYTGSFLRHFYFQLQLISVNYVLMPRVEESFIETMAKNPFLKNAYQNHMDMGLTSTLYYTSSTYNNPNPKESYWYSRLQFDLSGNVLSLFNPLMPLNDEGQRMLLGVPYSQYVRLEATLGRTLVWGKDMNNSLAMRLLAGAGYAYGNSSALPFEKHFYSGGANSLRGWAARTVGPGSAALETAWVIPNQTGDMKLEANIEYRFPIVWRIMGALFVDAGNVWNLDKSADEQTRFSFKTLPQTIAADWGAGIRLDMTFLILRVDFGMRVHDPARSGSKWVAPKDWFKKDGYAFHFGVGYPF